MKYECAVALLRLRRPPEYYLSKYGNVGYGFSKLALLLEKQHNRGDNGAGIASLRLTPESGRSAYLVERSVDRESPLSDLLGRCAEKDFSQCGIFLGHLNHDPRGMYDISSCPPFFHDSSCLRRVLLLAGNFSLTNTDELFEHFRKQGQFPASKADGYLIAQMIAHYLEQDSNLHEGTPDWRNILYSALNRVDGAFTLCGFNGDGDAFVVRDSHAIRSCYFYFDDEVFVAASERQAIQATFNCSTAEVMEIPAGKAVVVLRSGEVQILDCLETAERRSCVFERISFSRPNDAEIHRERKSLGKAIVPELLENIDYDFDNTFFSYIPNSARAGFHGMLEELMKKAFSKKKSVRFGQIAVKDARFHTFISDTANRWNLGMHVYDITYGLVHPGTDTLVVLDDSIVQGDTMRDAILPLLNRLDAKKIVVASSAPIVRYPDCYGIDMACPGELIAFRAAVSLLKKNNRESVLQRAYENAKKDLAGQKNRNRLKEIYDAVDDSELLDEIALLLLPPGFTAELQFVYQSMDALRKSCPQYTGDWYFSGDYPTPGGLRMVNQSLVDYMEKKL